MVHSEESLIEVSHAIGIELKNRSAPVPTTTQARPRAFPREGARLLLDNDRVAAWDVQWMNRKPVPVHVHERDTIVIVLEEGQVQFTKPDGENRTVRQRTGEAIFVSRDESHSEEAVEGSPRAIFVELK